MLKPKFEIGDIIQYNEMYLFVTRVTDTSYHLFIMNRKHQDTDPFEIKNIDKMCSLVQRCR